MSLLIFIKLKSSNNFFMTFSISIVETKRIRPFCEKIGQILNF